MPLDPADDAEEDLLRSVALQNANIILVARQRAEQEMLAAKQELRVSNERNRKILESISDGFMAVDGEWRLTYLNQRAQELLRPVARTVPTDAPSSSSSPASSALAPQSEPESEPQSEPQSEPRGLLGRSCWEVFPDLVGTAVEAGYRRAVAEQVPMEFELHHARLDRWFEVRAYPAPGALSSYFHDITQRKRDEQALREHYAAAQRAAAERQVLLDSERAARGEAERASRMKDDFLSILSHELRTPLNAILGWANVLQSKIINGPPDVTRGLATIERNARMQNRLIEDLLDMSRIAAGKMSLDVHPIDPVSFVEAALDTLKPAAAAKEISLHAMLDSTAASVHGDANRLQQVAWNLLSNAIKFTPRGGKVQVLLERVGSHVEISVTDTGQGIAAEFLPFVFQRFRQEDSSTTRRHGGLGLGLSIAKHLVELHGGTLAARSDGLGKGAMFSLRLPVAIVRGGRLPAEGLEGAPASPSYHLTDLTGLKVLIVDDERDACELVRSVLASCGADVVTAGSAVEALALLQQSRPDVIVSDIGMPDVDGYEFIRRVRALGEAGKIPAIALTAFARSEDRTRSLRAGYIAHLSKPAELAELVATVASVAGRATG